MDIENLPWEGGVAGPVLWTFHRMGDSQPFPAFWSAVDTPLLKEDQRQRALG